MKPKTLYGKIFLAFLLVISVLAIAQYFVLSRFSASVLQERDQRLNWDLAERFAAELKPLLLGAYDEKQIIQELLRLGELHPAVDVYLLDENGRVLFGIPFLGAEAGRGMQLAEEPIKVFLEQGTSASLPILGSNPAPGLPKSIFSVAPITTSEGSGYVYLLLHGRRYYMADRGIQDYHTLLNATSAMAVLFVSAVVFIALLFRWITRPFRSVTSRVDQITGGDLEARIDAVGDDEIAQLGRQINEMTDALCHNIETAKRNDRMRREFVANVSHDLATPLTSIDAHLDSLLNDKRLSSEQQIHDRLLTISRNLDRLTNLAKKLFELSKLEAREKEPDLHMFNCQELIEEELFPKLTPLAEKKGISLRLDAPVDNVMALGDISLIERVLSNLVENAIHYHDKLQGEVVLSLIKNHKQIAISVSDNGPGIAAEHLPHIFDRFYRVESTKDGTGLGLAIVKNIIETHKSSISVSSTSGQGTTFSFELPLAT